MPEGQTGQGMRRAPSCLRSVVCYAACRLASQHGRFSLLQHAAPVLQQDDASATGLQQSPSTSAVAGGTLALPQQAAPAMAAGGVFCAARHRRRLCTLHGAFVAAASALTSFVSGHVTFAVLTAALTAARLGIGHGMVFVGCYVALTVFAAAFAPARLAISHLAVFAHRTLVPGAACTTASLVAGRRSSWNRLCRCLRHHRQRKQRRDYYYHQLRFHDFLVY